MNIKQFDRKIVKELSDEIVEILRKELSEKYELNIERGNCSYQDTNFSLQINVAIEKDGVVLTREAQAFIDFIDMFSNGRLKPSDLNKEFKLSGDTFKIIGLSTKSKKYPIIVEKDNGKQYKYAIDIIAEFIGK